MLHGVLLDPSAEFFIAIGAVEWGAGGTEGKVGQASAAEGAGVAGGPTGQGGVGEEATYREWHQGYRVSGWRRGVLGEGAGQGADCWPSVIRYKRGRRAVRRMQGVRGPVFWSPGVWEVQGRNW